MDGNGGEFLGVKSNIHTWREEKSRSSYVEHVSVEKEKLLYIIAGERPGEQAAAWGQRLVNDAYHGSPCEDSLGYSNDCIYIQPQTQEMKLRQALAFKPHSYLTWLIREPYH